MTARAKKATDDRRQWWRVPLVAEILADSAEAAYQAVGEAVGTRNREHPDHQLRIQVGPESDVEGWRDEEAGA